MTAQTKRFSNRLNYQLDVIGMPKEFMVRRKLLRKLLNIPSEEVYRFLNGLGFAY